MVLDKSAVEESIGSQILAGAMRVHSAFGPGLLEGAYEACLAYDLEHAGLHVERQIVVPVEYGGHRIDAGY